MAVNLVIWVIGTWLIGAVVVNAAHRSGAGQLARQVRMTAEGQLVGDVAAFVFHIGIPFVAVIVGALGLDLMVLGHARPNALLGFEALDWVRGVGIVIGTVLFVLLVLWLMTRRGTSYETPAGIPAGTPVEVGWTTALRSAAYDEVHWAFYRSAGALWFGDLYSGAILGCLLIGLEWALQPGFRRQIQSAELRPQWVLKLICLIVSSGLYLGVQNLWLMMAAHGLLLIVGARFLSAHTAAAPTTNTPPLSSSQPQT